jgi:hypothetical protein
MTGSNLAVPGTAAWFGHQYLRESSVGWAGPGHRPMRNSLSPGLRISRADLVVSSPTLAFNLKSRGVSRLMWAEYQPGAKGPVQDRADGGRSFSYSLPRLRIAGSLTYTR